MAKSKKSLAETHPELVKEWHPSKNTLSPLNVTKGSEKKIWWKCDKGVDHEWIASVNNRTSGRGCPFCSNKRVSQSNNLEHLFPNIAREWHTTLNVSLSPSELVPGSNKKVWWKCDNGDDHIWKSSPQDRVSGRGCPVCAGKKTVPSNSLATLNPRLAAEWHPTLNETLTPMDVSTGSGKLVWWKCEKGDDHEWIAKVNDRSNGRGCPICDGKTIVKSNSLKTISPQVAKQWHPTLNGTLKPSQVSPGSSKNVWWKCEKGDDHVWKASIKSRKQVRCPICSGQKTVRSTSLAHLKPYVAEQWHPTLNGLLTPRDVGPGSNKKVWWKCNEGEDHIWQTSVAKRKSGSGCPICSNHKLIPSNSLATLNPRLAAEWHPTLNETLTPMDVSIGSSKKVWWKCNEGEDHIWQTSVATRKSGINCPVCAGKKTVPSNSLATLNPRLAAEWHPTLNETLTPMDVSTGSGKLVWWKCEKGDDHIWRTSVSHRVSGKNCPICSNKKVVLSNCLATTNPDLSEEWHPSLNHSLTPLDLTAGSNRKVWWRCKNNNQHEWKIAPVSRLNGSGCPYCTLTPQSKQELIITFELKTLFRRIDPRGFKTKLDGRLRAIDIFIPQLNLCIEFDGSYWHKGKREIDKIKSNLLLKEGYSVIRVREEPLKKIHNIDVISKKPYDGKQVTNDILSMILSMYDLDSELVDRIKEYQSEDELQNEKGLNRYIDKILKEKAERNSN